MWEIIGTSIFFLLLTILCNRPPKFCGSQNWLTQVVVVRVYKTCFELIFLNPSLLCIECAKSQFWNLLRVHVFHLLHVSHACVARIYANLDNAGENQFCNHLATVAQWKRISGVIYKFHDRCSKTTFFFVWKQIVILQSHVATYQHMLQMQLFNGWWRALSL